MCLSFLVYLFLGGCLTTAPSMKRTKNLWILLVSLTHTVNLFLLKKHHQLNSKKYGRFRYLRLQYIWALKLFPVLCCYMDGNDGHFLRADVSYFLCCTRKRDKGNRRRLHAGNDGDGFINLKKTGSRIGRLLGGDFVDG